MIKDIFKMVWHIVYFLYFEINVMIKTPLRLLEVWYIVETFEMRTLWAQLVY